MIVVDTNVLSELARPAPDPRVLAWFRAADEDALRITTVTVTEILMGANRMNDSRASDRKAHVILEVIAMFHARTLSFGMIAAAECANIRSLREAAGRPVGLADAMIAATAIAAEADAIATRDKDFTDIGLPVLNPWSG